MTHNSFLLLVLVVVSPCLAQPIAAAESGGTKRVYAITVISWQDFKRRDALMDDGGFSVMGLDIAELKSLAAKGHTPSQCLLARLSYSGKEGVAEDKVEAYKWALIAGKTVESAKAMIKEFALFMPAEQVTAAKEAAASFLRDHRPR